ncbi:cupin domain-containing protein [Synechococcus sp. PCC 7502]|uniref:cupin domain-containing protein n=1 Tax=Synechococcus sp. PCC 7502 TaxID=1173263 RepID=UPI00029F8D66|nr:cupin domain-containing protein [Synechococcus sp. PCC 7502]AFY75257.1 cupin domain-containing protein [Synechococcus sp. PCC 7502]
MTSRVFASSNFLEPSDAEPIRTVVTESEHAAVIAWHLNPHQIISAHIHPYGQDTWTILAGEGQYFLDETGNTQIIRAGDVVVAPIGNVHGVINTGTEPLIFISVVTPSSAGYEIVFIENARAN